MAGGRRRAGRPHHVAGGIGADRRHRRHRLRRAWPTALCGAGLALIAAVRPLAASGWFPLRHAALQLTRPGGQVHLVLLTVGLGAFFILGVRGAAGEPGARGLGGHRRRCPRHVPARHPERPAGRGHHRAERGPPGGSAGGPLDAGPARPRRRRTGARGHARGRRRRPRPRLAGPRVHRHLPGRARAQRDGRGRRRMAGDAVVRGRGVDRREHPRPFRHPGRRHHALRRGRPDGVGAGGVGAPRRLARRPRRRLHVRLPAGPARPGAARPHRLRPRAGRPRPTAPG